VHGLGRWMSVRCGVSAYLHAAVTVRTSRQSTRGQTQSHGRCQQLAIPSSLQVERCGRLLSKADQQWVETKWGKQCTIVTRAPPIAMVEQKHLT
jgi:hypothetical protein